MDIFLIFFIVVNDLRTLNYIYEIGIVAILIVY